MNKQKNRRNRPDFDGNEQGIYKHNRAILRKTSTVCALCGLPFDKSLKFPHPMSLTIDHIIPVALGGKSTIDNLQAAHLVCNESKGKKIIGNNKKVVREDNNLPQYIDWSNYSE